MSTIMELLDVFCPICYEPYDSDERANHIWKCGHHTCKSCIRDIQKVSHVSSCTFCLNNHSSVSEDNTRHSHSLLSLNSFVKTLTAFQLNPNEFMAKIMGMENMCEVHNRTCKMFDLVDITPICMECFKLKKDTGLLMNIKPQATVIQAVIKDLNGMKSFFKDLHEKAKKKSTETENKTRTGLFKKELNCKITGKINLIKNRFQDIKANLDVVCTSIIDTMKANQRSFEAQYAKTQSFLRSYQNTIKLQQEEVTRVALEIGNKNYENIKTPYVIKNSLIAVKTELFNCASSQNIDKMTDKFMDVVTGFLEPINVAVNNFNVSEKLERKMFQLFDEKLITNNLLVQDDVEENKVPPVKKMIRSTLSWRN